MRIARILPLVAVLAGLHAGCAATTGPRDFAPPVARTPDSEYVLQPGDTILVKFYYHPDHDQEVLIRTDGKIPMPLVGDVQAAGRTSARLADELARRYSENLRDPKVSVTVRSMNQKGIYVGGEVNRPGMVPYRQGLSVLQAILEAGGPKDTARVDQVVLLQKLDENNYRASKVNVARMLEQGDSSADVALGPSDVLFVPKTGIAKLNTFVEQYVIRVLPLRPGLGFSYGL